MLVGFCLLASNALNVLVPNQMGVMIDSLTKYAQGGTFSRPIVKAKLTPFRFGEQHLASGRCLHRAAFCKRRCMHWLDSQMVVDPIRTIFVRRAQHSFSCTLDEPFVGFPRQQDQFRPQPGCAWRQIRCRFARDGLFPGYPHVHRSCDSICLPVEPIWPLHGTHDGRYGNLIPLHYD